MLNPITVIGQRDATIVAGELQRGTPQTCNSWSQRQTVRNDDGTEAQNHADHIIIK